MKKRVFCFDLDGTITTCAGFGLSEKDIPWQILWIGLMLYKPKIRGFIIPLLSTLKSSNNIEIIIITRRPQELEKITKKFLKKRGILYDKIFFIGTGPESETRKIKKIKEEGADFLFDNSESIVKKAKEDGIIAFLI